jgi:hypothetical protein
LRPGMISRESIGPVRLGLVEVAGEAAEGVARMRRRGRTRGHYAPLTALRLGTPGRESGYVWHTIPAEAASAVRLLAEAEARRGLYGALHALDAAGLPEIVVEPAPGRAGRGMGSGPRPGCGRRSGRRC